MKGDAANLARVMLVRLSAAAASVALSACFVFIAGTIGNLSGQALGVAAKGMGAAGLAAAALALAAILATIVAPTAGARFSVSTLVVAGLCGAAGIAAAVVSGMVGAVAGGLSF